MGRLTGKVALVTGAANGIGKATSLMPARKGATVFNVAVAPEVEAISSGGSGKLDVRTESEWEDGGL